MRDVNEAYDVLRDQEKRQAYDNLAAGVSPDGGFQPPPGWDEGFEFHRGRRPATRRNSASSSRPCSARAAAWASAGLPRARRRPPCGDRGGPGGRAAWRHPRHQPALDAHGRSRPTADEHAHLERAHSGGRARRPVHPPGRAGHAGLRRRRRERRPVSRSALRHMRAIASRPRPVHVLPVAPWEAALGAQVEAPTPGGAVEVSIPAGSANGRKLRCAAEAYLAIRLATCIWCWNWRCRRPTPRPPSRPIARCSRICPSTRAGTWEPEHEESRHRQRHRGGQVAATGRERAGARLRRRSGVGGPPGGSGHRQRRRRPPGRMAVS